MRAMYKDTKLNKKRITFLSYLFYEVGKYKLSFRQIGIYQTLAVLHSKKP